MSPRLTRQGCGLVFLILTSALFWVAALSPDWKSIPGPRFVIHNFSFLHLQCKCPLRTPVLPESITMMKLMHALTGPACVVSTSLNQSSWWRELRKNKLRPELGVWGTEKPSQTLWLLCREWAECWRRDRDTHHAIESGLKELRHMEVLQFKVD